MAVMANSMKAAGQHMNQKPPDKLTRLQAHAFIALTAVPTKYSIPDSNSPDIDRNTNQHFMQRVGTHDGDHRCEEMPQRDLYQETQPLCAGDTV